MIVGRLDETPDQCRVFKKGCVSLFLSLVGLVILVKPLGVFGIYIAVGRDEIN